MATSGDTSLHGSAEPVAAALAAHDSLPMVPSSRPRRKVRKGTKSCWECRHRKIKCIFKLPTDETCIRCARRGAQCVGQEHPEVMTTSLDRSLQMSDRVVRMETLINQLLTELPAYSGRHRLASSPAYDSRDDDQPQNRSPDSVTSPAFTSPKCEPLRASLSDAHPPSFQVLSQDPDSSPSQEPRVLLVKTSGHTRLSQALRQHLPSEEDVQIISKASSSTSAMFYQMQTVPYNALDATRSISSMFERPNIEAHPILIARHMLYLATSLQHLHPEFHQEIRGLSKVPHELRHSLVEIASEMVTTRDELVDSIEGLDCVIIESWYHANNGNLQKALITIRRAITLAQVMGFHRKGTARHTVICSETRAYPDLIWFRMLSHERYLCLMLGVPQSTRDQSMASDEMLSSDTPMGRLDRIHCVIACRLLERNQLNPKDDDYALTQELDDQLQAASKDMPSGWWLTPNLAAGAHQPAALFWYMRQLFHQLHHYSLLRPSDRALVEQAQISMGDVNRPTAHATNAPCSDLLRRLLEMEEEAYSYSLRRDHSRGPPSPLPSAIDANIQLTIPFFGVIHVTSKAIIPRDMYGECPTVGGQATNSLTIAGQTAVQSPVSDTPGINSNDDPGMPICLNQHYPEHPPQRGYGTAVSDLSNDLSHASPNFDLRSGGEALGATISQYPTAVFADEVSNWTLHSSNREFLSILTDTDSNGNTTSDGPVEWIDVLQLPSFLLYISVWPNHVEASAYSDIPNSCGLFDELGLTSTQQAQLEENLGGINLDDLSVLDPLERSSVACTIASIVFGPKFINQSASSYEDVVEENWSNTCWLRPQCAIQPELAQDVAKAMAILTFLDTKFSVRSGGHNPNPGFAGVGKEGILIDMSNMTHISLNEGGSIASLSPGNRFRGVAKSLNSIGRAVHGGRNNQVGIGGYFLGGGLTYFNSLYGLAADNVVNYEVVLANSSIINANAHENQDLWWALKGSGTNFGKTIELYLHGGIQLKLNYWVGIVTKYDVKVTANSPYWFEALNYAPDQIPTLLQAIVKYAVAAEEEPYADISFNLNPSQAFVAFIYAEPVVRPNVFKMFYDIPPKSQAINSTIGNMMDLNNAMSNITPERHLRRLVTSIVHKFSTKLLDDIYGAYAEFDSVAQSIGAVTGMTVQPFTSAAVRHGLWTGGNPVGLTETLQNHMEFFIQWGDSDNDEAAVAALQSITAKVETLAQQRGAYLKSKIMNDAGFYQNVLASYGPENLSRLRDVAVRYDPLQLMIATDWGDGKLQNGLIDLTIICQGVGFAAHRYVVCDQSPVLRAALTGNFSKAQSRTVSIDFDLESVKRFLEFLYTGDYHKVPDPALSRIVLYSPCDERIQRAGENVEQAITLACADHYQAASAEDSGPDNLQLNDLVVDDVKAITESRLCHCRMSNLADYYDMTQLSKTSLAKLEEGFRSNWSADPFCALLLESLNEISNRDTLCLLGKTAAEHYDELIASNIFEAGGPCERLAPFILPSFARILKGIDGRRQEAESDCEVLRYDLG
ncbi:hypothetical protein NPX13_g3549 [Xylaria arbuscula]|uniref:Zn(2)-C6 fungal-type domain-containing protein n=1 Tax=Xylaria arbuscula TaxID=114810 RepID=A0A9W8NH35_9PEZI|nr:hypothetical protein NPX13_g3549 [Xylaria arbuscula]